MKSRKLVCFLAAAAFCAVSSVSQATVKFRNSGTTSGWDGSNLDSGCSITDSTSVSYKGGQAVKCQAVWNGSSHRYHAMKTHSSGYKLGETGFYGFAFYLSSSWDQSGGQQYQLFQFIADFGSTGCDDWQPSCMIWVSGSQLATRRNYGSSACSRTTQSYTGLASVSRGVWHRIVIQGHWTNDSSGFYRLWFDGSQKLSVSGAVTINDGRQYRMDVGLYANSWYDQKTVTGSGTRQLWFDQVSMGTTFAEADPSAW